ncbi:MFS transporter [Candidatus Spongiisocius sp.]|uniref:MFS transporter n=1 Tax=Candidatus Spongiisocius sp. TaxID=3101273 RepID=UPI003B594101
MSSSVMSGSAPRPDGTARTILGSRGLLLAVLFVMLGNGMMNPLLGIRAELEGFSTTATGTILAFYYVGFLAGAWITRRLVTDVGHIRVYAALASLASTSTLIYILNASPAVWSLARLINGFAMSGLFIVGESWLNEAATNRTRGRMLAIYMVVLMGGLAAGQMLIVLGDPSGIALFIAASILVSIAVIPITLSTSSAPTLVLPGKLPVAQVWHAAPLGIFAAFSQGVGVAALLTLGAVYGARSGMSVERIALFTSAAVVGSVVLQPAIGELSDRLGRRRLILGTGFVCAGACLAMVHANPLGWLAMTISFLVGGLALSMYPLALSHINDRVPPGSAIGVSTVLSLAGGIGAVIGPVAGAQVMDAAGPAGLYWFVGVVFLVTAMFSLFRIFTREGVPADRRRPFALIPARAGTVIVQMARRMRQPGERAARDRPDGNRRAAGDMSAHARQLDGARRSGPSSPSRREQDRNRRGPGESSGR